MAVLPFVNLAGDLADQTFGDGLADDVINELVRIPGLRVIARTSSFAVGGERDVREIGAQLGADWLLEGSVRRDRQRVRVSVQLVNTQNGGHAWGERYDREITDIFAIQDEISLSIAQALRFTLTPRERNAPLSDLVAYDLWVKGRTLSQQFTRDAFEDARACYEDAISRCESFPRPHFGLADLLFYGAEFGLAEPAAVVPRAREAITRALQLDPWFGEAHAVLGVFRGLLDHDWPGAEVAFRQALELSPGSASVLHRNAWYHLVPRMKVAEALEQAQQAVALDPLSPIAHGHLGLVLVVARQYDSACDSCRTAVQLAPSLWYLHWFYATALLCVCVSLTLVNGARAAFRCALWPLSGFALGAHITAPLLLMPVLLANLRRSRSRPRCLAQLALCVSIGALVLLYLPLASVRDTAFDWGDPQTFSRWLRHLSAARIREAYAAALFNDAGQVR
ncbi:MAG: tetratricopeptide repeat protein, partial [Gemmatimonadota bacterium]